MAVSERSTARGSTPAVGRLSRVRRSLTRAEWTKVAGMATVVIGLHVVGWVTLAALVAPRHYSLGTKGFGLAIGFTAYSAHHR